MNKKVVGGVALGVLIGSVAIWLREPESGEPVSIPPAADPRPQFEAAPVPEPAAASSAPAGESAEKEVVQNVMPTEAPKQIFPTDQNPGAGYYLRPVSKDLEIYLQVVDAAAYSEVVNETSAQLLRNMQAQLEITDDELEQLIEIAKPMLESDRAFQAAGFEAVCKKGSTFKDVAELGAALDEEHREAVANQEALGRKALDQLDPLLALKIRNKIHNQPLRHSMTGDISIVMARRNHGMEVELGRICNFGK